MRDARRRWLTAFGCAAVVHAGVAWRYCGPNEPIPVMVFTNGAPEAGYVHMILVDTGEESAPIAASPTRYAPTKKSTADYVAVDPQRPRPGLWLLNEKPRFMRASSSGVVDAGPN